MKVGVTGANGFVGQALCKIGLAQGHDVLGIVSQPGHCDGAIRKWLTRERDFVNLASEAAGYAPLDCVIHLASRVHQLGEGHDAHTLLSVYRETNVAGSVRVAEAAHVSGARRFVFVSSIKAMGETDPGNPPRAWRENDSPVPGDPYGVSKLEAEHELTKVCARLQMELVIIRPPLVYGPEVKANFQQLMSLVARGLPLPLASIQAQRSMIYVDNLVSAIWACATHDNAPGHAFFVSDGKDMTVAQVVGILGQGLGKHARLFPMPPVLLNALAGLAGKQAQADRLLRPLRVNIDLIRATLGWHPPVDAQIGLRTTAIWYRGKFDLKP